MPEYTYVGRSVPRIDAGGKVTGRTLYAADLHLPRMLHAKVLRSPHAHALIRGIDTSRAKALPGVAAILTARDLPRAEALPDSRQQDVMALAEVIYCGQAVAAALAEDPHIAEEALGLIDVAYQELPAVIDPVEAMRPDATPARQRPEAVNRREEAGHIALAVAEERGPGGSGIQGSPNVVSQVRFARGDVEQGFAEADLVVEATYRAPRVHQGYIEPQATVASYDPTQGLTIWTSTQAPFHVREQVAEFLRLPEYKVRVIATEVGGGFGGKILLDQVLVASLAMVTGRPVKYVRTRREDLAAANPADNVIVRLKMGMKRDGSLAALQAEMIYDTGAIAGSDMRPGAVAIGSYYRCPNLEIHGYEVLTNKCGVGAFRAPGAPQATFAIESQMDTMAKALGLDPLEVRLNNAVQEGDPLSYGAPYPRIGLQECLLALVEHPLWKERERFKQGSPHRGVGMAVGCWLGGLQPASAQAALNADGTVTVITGVSDITGAATAFTQIAAEELGLPLERVAAVMADTSTAPYVGMSAGSKTIYTAGRAVKLAAEDARRQILEIAAQRLGVPPEALECRDGRVWVSGEPARAMDFQQIGTLTTSYGGRFTPVIGRGAVATRRQAPSFTVQGAAVEVDPETGQIALLGHVTIQDVGFAINPLAVAGQMEGGTSQGIGIALSEELIYDEEGHLLNPSLLDYRLPTTVDIPHIESVIVEVPSEEGPYGARIVGEPSIVPVSAAVANAVYDAIAARVYDLPLTAERVLRALGRLPQE